MLDRNDTGDKHYFENDKLVIYLRNGMCQPADFADDEISLIDVVNFIQEGWKQILFVGAVGCLIGLGYALLTPSKFRAVAAIQGATVAGQPVESPSVLLEKLKLPLYYSQETIAKCGLKDNSRPGETLANVLNPTMVTAPVITFSFAAKSPAEGKACLESVLLDIRADQEKIAKPLIQLRMAQLANVKKRLDFLEDVVAKLDGEKLYFEKNEMMDLRNSIYAKQLELAEPQTQAVSLAAPIYAPDSRVSPNRSLAVFSGTVGGLFIGLLLLFARRFLQNFKLKP